MEGLKIIKMKLLFHKEVQHLQSEFDSFFKDKRIDDYYLLTADKTTGTLSLEITDKTLPNNIQRRLFKLFLEFNLENNKT